MKPICILLVTIICWLGTSVAQNASKPGLVGNLKQNFDGCGCYFKFSGTRKNSPKLIFAEFDQNKVWMNIDGRDVRLNLVKETRGERESVGSKWTRTLAGPNISVTST